MHWLYLEKTFAPVRTLSLTHSPYVNTFFAETGLAARLEYIKLGNDKKIGGAK